AFDAPGRQAALAPTLRGRPGRLRGSRPLAGSGCRGGAGQAGYRGSGATGRVMNRGLYAEGEPNQHVGASSTGSRGRGCASRCFRGEREFAIRQTMVDSERRPVLVVGAMVDRYELLGVLGRGAMGEVWRARHVVTQGECALKVLHPDLARDERL